MALNGQQNGDIRTTMSRDKALSGALCTSNLPGERKFSLTLPPHNGQELRREDQGQPVTGGKLGALILASVVAWAEKSAPFLRSEANTPTAFIPALPPSPSISSLSYSATGAIHTASHPGMDAGSGLSPVMIFFSF